MRKRLVRVAALRAPEPRRSVPGYIQSPPEKRPATQARRGAAAVCLLDLLPKFQAAAIYYRCTLMVLQVFHFLRPYLLIVDVLSNNL